MAGSLYSNSTDGDVDIAGRDFSGTIGVIAFRISW
jgi:hypothetical protein